MSNMRSHLLALLSQPGFIRQRIESANLLANSSPLQVLFSLFDRVRGSNPDVKSARGSDDSIKHCFEIVLPKGLERAKNKPCSSQLTSMNRFFLSVLLLSALYPFSCWICLLRHHQHYLVKSTSSLGYLLQRISDAFMGIGQACLVYHQCLQSQVQREATNKVDVKVIHDKPRKEKTTTTSTTVEAMPKKPINKLNAQLWTQPSL